jgi:hypothetical protein
MFPKKNGVPFIERTKLGGEMRPYKIWDADMWACSKCGASVLIGFGERPFALNHEESFKVILAKIQEDPWVIVEQEK